MNDSYASSVAQAARIALEQKELEISILKKIVSEMGAVVEKTEATGSGAISAYYEIRDIWNRGGK